MGQSGRESRAGHVLVQMLAVHVCSSIGVERLHVTEMHQSRNFVSAGEPRRGVALGGLGYWHWHEMVDVERCMLRWSKTSGAWRTHVDF